MTDAEEGMSKDEFIIQMNRLAEHLMGESEDTPPEPQRTWPDDTLMRDLPEDMTGAESLVVFGTEFDSTTKTLHDIYHQLGQGHAFHELIEQAGLRLASAHVHIDETDTIAEAKPKGMLLDLVAIGLLAHTLAQNIEFGGAFPISGLLNGKGPFGG